MMGETTSATSSGMKAPWTAGLTFRCNQGNFGAFSHDNPLSYYAWDFGLPLCTPVLASAYGVIYLTGYSNNGYGNFIIIKHIYGLNSIYGHLCAMNGAIGKSVKQGEIIGYSGNTGRTTGPHLHFSMIDSRGYSLPSQFEDIGVPEEGGYYRSENCILKMLAK
jgi:murein DD-endopeptidase MepM/ murein hydrolase activator NlpD